MNKFKRDKLKQEIKEEIRDEDAIKEIERRIIQNE